MTYRRLSDLPAAFRASGLPVVLIDGWQTRGRPAHTGGFAPRGQMAHHTGAHGTNTRRDERAYVERVLVPGFSHLPGPLCQVALGRQTRDGAPCLYIVAAGRANHAGAARAAGFLRRGDGNSQALGYEALNSGFEGWPPEQLAAYHRATASAADFYRWPRANVVSHHEGSTTGKWDPGINYQPISMATFRRAVADAQLGDKPMTEKELQRLAELTARAVLTYKNPRLEGDRDVYDLLRRAARSWSYKRKGDKRDASQILVDIDTRVARLEQQIGA